MEFAARCNPYLESMKRGVVVNNHTPYKNIKFSINTKGKLRLVFNYAMMQSYQKSDLFISKQHESIAF